MCVPEAKYYSPSGPVGECLESTLVMEVSAAMIMRKRRKQEYLLARLPQWPAGYWLNGEGRAVVAPPLKTFPRAAG